MARNKEVVSWTIDKDVVEKINNEAENFERSKSYIANKYLKQSIK